MAQVRLCRACAPGGLDSPGDEHRDLVDRARSSRAVTEPTRAGSSLVMTLVDDRDRWVALVGAAQRGDASVLAGAHRPIRGHRGRLRRRPVRRSGRGSGHRPGSVRPGLPPHRRPPGPGRVPGLAPAAGPHRDQPQDPPPPARHRAARRPYPVATGPVRWWTRPPGPRRSCSPPSRRPRCGPRSSACPRASDAWSRCITWPACPTRRSPPSSASPSLPPRSGRGPPAPD